MKRTAALLLAALLTATAAAGCSSKEEGSSSSMGSSSSSMSSSESSSSMKSYRLNSDMTLEGLFDEIRTAFYDTNEMLMPEKVTMEVLERDFGLTSTQVKEVYGQYSTSPDSSDHLIVIQAQPGKAEEVKAALERRQQDLMKRFEDYPKNGPYENAKAAKVHVMGDYVFYFGADMYPGNGDAEFDTRYSTVTEILNKSFS